MPWNYRVTLVPGPEPLYSIKEVYYDDQGQPNGVADAGEPYGDTVDELRQVLQHMLEALDKPVFTPPESWKT